MDAHDCVRTLWVDAEIMTARKKISNIKAVALVNEDGTMDFLSIDKFPRVDVIGEVYVITDPDLRDVPKIKVIGRDSTWEVIK